MPTYDYVCDLCAHAFEHFQGMSEPLLVECPRCGKRGLRRLIGAGAGLLFKGSGFYETDYKRKPETGKTGSTSPTGAGSDGPPDKKSGAGGSGSGDAAGGDTAGAAKPDSATGSKPAGPSATKPDAKAGNGKDSKPSGDSGKPASGGKSA